MRLRVLMELGHLRHTQRHRGSYSSIGTPQNWNHLQAHLENGFGSKAPGDQPGPHTGSGAIDAHIRGHKGLNLQL